MAYPETVRTVRETLCSEFARVDAWFDRPETIRRYVPAAGTWSIDLVLEHIALTNRFLMLTFGKYCDRASKLAARGDPIPQGESDLERLKVIGERGTFGWERPEHMEPTGLSAPDEVRATLHRQLGECLIRLEGLDGGIGAMCRVTMTVNDLGKIDLYQWLYFLAMHSRRHIDQMERAEAEFLALGGGR